ncbi:MAG: hypothetical protein AAF405_06580, partial [Pseudomonadota bacterium]
IEFTKKDRTHYLKVGDVGENSMTELDGDDGGLVQVTNTPLAVAPGYPITIGKSDSVTYKDNGIDWEKSGTVGLYSPFTYGP